MATSVLMREKNIGDFEETIRPPQNGRQNGRRKSKLTEQKKKQPQRGMGVAMLERLRREEKLKNMTDINNNPLPPLTHPHYFSLPPFPHPSSSSAFPAPFPRFGGSYGPTYGINVLNQHSLFHSLGHGGFGGVFSDQFQGDPYEIGTSNPSSSFIRAGNGNGNHENIIVGHETSKELSSMPNRNCLTHEHCGLCQKKKRVNSDKLSPINDGCGNFLGLNLGNKQSFAGENQGFGTTTVAQEVGVLAVHRKGSSGVLNSGRSSVLMEYEFFPGKRDICNEEFDYSATTTASHSNIGFDDSSNSVDLSLKLSY